MFATTTTTNILSFFFLFLFTSVACQDPSELQGLSTASLMGLLEVAERIMTMETVETFSIAIIVIWIIFYISSKLVWFIMERSERFRNMLFDNKRTCVIYVLNIVYTTLIFIGQMTCLPVLVSQYFSSHLFMIQFLSSVLSILYLFELTYRSSLRLPMLAHHFFTIFAISFLMYSFDTTHNPSIATTGLLWIFQASTEQMVFVGLLMYRFMLPPKITIFCLRFGAIQAITCKFASTIYMLVWWGLKQSKHTSTMGIAYSVVLVIANGGLSFTQFYGSWVIWRISSTYTKKYEEEILGLKSNPTNKNGAVEGEEKRSSSLDSSSSKVVVEGSEMV